jgi:hypothetical protein
MLLWRLRFHQVGVGFTFFSVSVAFILSKSESHVCLEMNDLKLHLLNLFI